MNKPSQPKPPSPSQDPSHWQVQIGKAYWLAHTYERPGEFELRFLGRVQRGACMGALAVDAQGKFFQVNGDYVSPIGGAPLRRAVQNAMRDTRMSSPSASVAAADVQALHETPLALAEAMAAQARTPRVIVKRRRIPVPV